MANSMTKMGGKLFRIILSLIACIFFFYLPFYAYHKIVHDMQITWVGIPLAITGALLIIGSVIMLMVSIVSYLTKDY
jgi:TRAP-type C4-dicarboxylate transport system permease small subunit